MAGRARKGSDNAAPMVAMVAGGGRCCREKPGRRVHEVEAAR
jgi:hypothetical protein